MTKERLKIQYNVNADTLKWEPHYSGLYEVACVGDYAVYKELATDTYEVVKDGSVCRWRVDLSQEG